MHDAVLEALMDQIITGHLQPGDLIDDRDVAQRLGVSRAPVRTALDLLAEVGLVTIAPRQFTAVAPVSLRRVRESVEVLVDLSGAVLRQVPTQLSNADRDTLLHYQRDVLDADDHVMRGAVRDYAWDSRVLAPLSRSLGDRELIRARSWVVPYVRWASHRYADTIDAVRERRVQRAVVDALLAGEPAAVETAWADYGASLLAQTVGVDVAAAVGIDRSMRSVHRPLRRDAAADDIQNAILDGTLLPGEVLPETALRTWLGLSRTPVRAALARLAELGLVELEPARKARVATIDPASVRSTLGTLGILRAAAVRATVASGSAQLAGSLDSVDEKALDDAGAAAVTARFMETIDIAGGNSVERAIASRFEVRARWFGHRGWLRPPEQTVTHLRAISSAVADGDGTAASAAVAALYAIDPGPPPTP